MSIIGKIIGWLRSPKHETTGYGPLYSSLVTTLTRTGVKVGGTSFYPRVEVYGFTEGPRMDKEGRLRPISFTVESISNRSMNEAVELNEDNMQLLTGDGIVTPDGWQVIGIVPDTLQDMTETSDTNKIIYRLVQSYNLWLERLEEEDNNNQNSE